MKIFTERLLLITCPLELAKSIVLKRQDLDLRSSLTFPSDWPSVELKSILPFYIEKLERNSREFGWFVWLIIDYKKRTIIGNACFRGEPNVNGVIEIGYQISSAFQNKGYCFEAVHALVDWAFLNDSVKTITAECVETNMASIRVLEKIGMCCVGKEDSFLIWELNKAI